MKIVKLTKKNWQKIIFEAKEVLINNGLVVFPSDTVYGLAANAKSEKAVNKLLSFKNRPAGQAISISIKNLAEVNIFTKASKQTLQTVKTFLPGPFTLALLSRHLINNKLETEDGTIGLRLTNFSFMNDLNQALPFPYTSTSANIHSKGPHYSIQSLLNTLSERKKNLLDLVIDFGELPHNKPSTVINLDKDRMQILRQGDLIPKFIFKSISNSEVETKEIAKKLLNKYQTMAEKEALVFILRGDLGAGKTIFTKGFGEFLQTENIISPTFVIFYEYKTQNKIIKNLYHFDLYRLETLNDLNDLSINRYLKKNNLLVLEWGEKIGSIKKFLNKKRATLFLVDLKEKTETKREITIYKIQS